MASCNCGWGASQRRASWNEGLVQPAAGTGLSLCWGDGLQRVSHFVDLAFARGVGKEVELQGAAGRDHAVARAVAGDSGLGGWVLRGSR